MTQAIIPYPAESAPRAWRVLRIGILASGYTVGAGLGPTAHPEAGMNRGATVCLALAAFLPVLAWVYSERPKRGAPEVVSRDFGSLVGT